MKNVINNFLLSVITGFIIMSCSKTDNYVKVSLHQMQVPVLKFKKNNPVLQITMVTTEDTLSHNVTSVTVSTEGTEDLTDIKTVRLFYLGKDSLWTKKSKPVQCQVLVLNRLHNLLYQKVLMTARPGVNQST